MRGASVRTAASRAVGWSARLAGWTGSAVRSIPGAAGALLIAYGAWQAWTPAGAIVAGLFLLAADRRIP